MGAGSAKVALFLAATDTKCRIRLAKQQIEAKALRKLRHPSRSRKLRAFLEGPSRDYL